MKPYMSRPLAQTWACTATVKCLNIIRDRFQTLNTRNTWKKRCQSNPLMSRELVNKNERKLQFSDNTYAIINTAI